MDQLNPNEINDALKDVRNAYRLLALYQTRLLDVIKYSANAFNVTFNSGWSKFSNAASHGNRASIEKLSWDWLTLYLYEFNLGGIDLGENRFNFKIVHQADTGFYDASEFERVSPKNVDQFGDVNEAVTRLFFVMSKNDNGCPKKNILNGNLKSKDQDVIVKGNWLAVPYTMQRFSNHTETDRVLNDFNEKCKSTFGVDLLHIVKE
ncbi:hypothetical protein [Nonlabens dokdonensis]|uniref:hypothetical protein n=1 Tax=Nonlabens dokdonensis TaxID=328515 RepID=UPI0026EF6AF8|nr:hypothetical protein [Nonlabens dokdonensis]